MANKIEILVEVDPNGRGAAAIRGVTAQVETLGRKSREAGSAGRDALDGFAGGLGIPTSLAAVSAALGAGIAALGVQSVKTSNQYANALRVLKSDTQEAGLQIAETRKEALKLGDDLALNIGEAERSYGKFIRVLKAGGLLEERDKYTKQFKDLTAAYGLTANEIETLTSQLLNGQDEALNKLGIADPSQLYKRYAESVGKTVEALTEEEKARARVLAVTEKGERFAGVAEERLASAPGQWATLQKQITDTTAALGDYLQKQTIVGDIPALLSPLFAGGNKTSLDLVADREAQRRKARAGEIFREEQARLDKFTQLQRDSLGVPEALNSPFGSFSNRVTLIGRDQAEKERTAFIAQYETLFKDKKLDRVTAEFAERQFREIRGIFDPKKSAEIESQFNKFWDRYAKTALSALKSAREGAEKFYQSVAERGAGADNPFVKVITEADNAARSLERTFGVLGKNAVRELQKIEDSFTRQKILSLELDAQLKANALRREAESLESPTGLSGRQDRLLSELDARINAATNSPELLAIANAINRGDVGNRQISAEEILQRRFASERGVNFDALTEQEKFLALRGRQSEIDRINARGGSFTASGLRTSQDDITRQAIDNLRELENFGFQEGATFGTKAKEALNSALVNLFNSLSPELQASIATGAESLTVKASFADAFEGAAEALRERIKEEIATQAVADRAITGVREDIATIERLRLEGVSTSQADARLLAATGALNPNELTADLRQARIESLRREADRQTQLQEDALKATQETRDAANKLVTSIDTLAGELRKPENRRVLIEVNNRAKATVREELYGSLQQEE